MVEDYFSPSVEEAIRFAQKIAVNFSAPHVGTEHLLAGISKDVKEFLVKEGYGLTFGARPLKRTVDRYISQPLANALLRGDFRESDRVEVYISDGRPSFKKAK